MAKIKLGNRPKNFKKVISVDMLDGTKGSFEVTYIYRTKVEFGAFLDKMYQNTDVKPDSDKGANELVMEMTRDSNAEYIMQVIEGWNLDHEFNLENVQQLCSELPGAANAIMSTYRAAIIEGRLAN